MLARTVGSLWLAVPRAGLLMMCAVTSCTAWSQTLWTNPGTGNWNTPGNWSLGVPNAASGTAFDAIVANGGTAELLAPPGGSVRRLRVGLAGGGGSLLVDAAHLQFTDNLHLNEGAGGVATTIIQNGGTISGPSAVLAHTGAGTSNFTVTGQNSRLFNTFLTVGQGGTANLNIEDGGTVIVLADLAINSLSNINLNGGTLDLNTISGSGGASRINYTAGTIRVSSTDFTVAPVTTFFGTTPIIPAGKGLAVRGTARITTTPVILAGGTLSAQSLVVMTGGRLWTTQASQAVGPVIALADSVIDARAGALVIGSATAVNGFYSNGTLLIGANTVTLDDANDAVFDSASLTTLGWEATAGTLAAANGLTLDFGGNITGFGTIDTPDTITTPLINNGHITGSSPDQPITLNGYVKGVGTFDNVSLTGTFSPGLSPTSLVVGNLALSPTSTLVMEIGGTTAGSGYDRLLSSGLLTLDGTLQVALLNGFVPAAGHAFDLLDWTARAGTFDNLLLPTLPTGRAWDISQLHTSGTLAVAAAGILGDYNNSGQVEQGDLDLVLQNWGDNTPPVPSGWTNDLPNGQIDQAELDKVLSNWGNTSAPDRRGVDLAAVPEPGAGLVCLAIFAGTITRRSSGTRPGGRAAAAL